MGNSWSVPVVAWLLAQLFAPLGLCPLYSPQEIVDLFNPAKQVFLQSRLWRLPLRPQRLADAGAGLVRKLGNLISVKGEDILLTTPTSQLCRFHRLRASVPSRLWRWKIVSGWSWTGSGEHINSLELRAVLTTVKWRVIHQGHLHCRFLHLVDSLVALHALSRGRSSSRKLRRTLSKVNALLLVSSSQALWGYVHIQTRILLTNPVVGVAGFAQSLNMPKRVLEASSQADRAKQRKALGTLQQLTVQPATKQRYTRAVDRFLAFLKDNDQVLPTQRKLLDPLLCEYLEHLWAQGFGRALASDTIAGLQDADVHLRRQLHARVLEAP